MLLAATAAALLVAATPAPAVHVDCAARAEPPPPEPPRARTVSAALPDGGRLYVLNVPGRPSRTRLGGRAVFVWKTPVVLSADRSVVVAIGRRQARRTRLGVGGSFPSFARSPRTARLTSCPEDEPRFSGPGVVGPLTGWGGSMVTLRRRSCLRLRVHSGGATVPLRVPLGRRCT